MSNIPALRFPDFEDDWQLKKIGTLTERVSNPKIRLLSILFLPGNRLLLKLPGSKSLKICLSQPKPTGMTI
jgi:hypothetical protein